MIGKNTATLHVYINKKKKEVLRKQAKKLEISLSEHAGNILSQAVDKVLVPNK